MVTRTRFNVTLHVHRVSCWTLYRPLPRTTVQQWFLQTKQQTRICTIRNHISRTTVSRWPPARFDANIVLTWSVNIGLADWGRRTHLFLFWRCKIANRRPCGQQCNAVCKSQICYVMFRHVSANSVILRKINDVTSGRYPAVLCSELQIKHTFM
jgi:hypothetical protein